MIKSITYILNMIIDMISVSLINEVKVRWLSDLYT
jgi:hypothetical protein